MKNTLRQPLVNRLVRYGQIIIFGLTLGYCAMTIRSFLESSGRLTHMLIVLLLLPVLICFEYLLALIHEAGHMLGGLLSGRRLYSLNVAGLRLLRCPDGSFRTGYAAAPGMGGSCTMVTDRPRAPFFLYFLSGPLSTLIFGLICALLALRSYPSYDLLYDEALRRAILHIPMTLLSVQGIMGCIVNLIPQRFPGGYSDGMQLWLLSRDDGIRSDWEQLTRIAWEEYQGKSTPEMPDELFEALPTERLTNPYAIIRMLQRLGRMIDQRDFTAGLALTRELLEADLLLSPFQQLELIRTGALCEAMTTGPSAFCQHLQEPVMQRLMQATGRTVGTLMIRYAMAKLAARDETLAARHLADYSQAAARSPFRQQIRLDNELIGLIERKAHESKQEVPNEKDA